MPARDTYHDLVKAALIQDGWTITHDPYRLEYGQRNVYADLGAEKSFGAQKAGQKILVEVKSFLADSEIDDLEKALGQYILYRNRLLKFEPDRKPYLALPDYAFQSLFDHSDGIELLQDVKLNVFLFSVENQRIERWL